MKAFREDGMGLDVNGRAERIEALYRKGSSATA